MGPRLGPWPPVAQMTRMVPSTLRPSPVATDPAKLTDDLSPDILHWRLKVAPIPWLLEMAGADKVGVRVNTGHSVFSDIGKLAAPLAAGAAR